MVALGHSPCSCGGLGCSVLWRAGPLALPHGTDSSPCQVLEDEKAARYIHGIGIHWYLDFIGPIQDTVLPTHELFPDYFILATEACIGAHFWERDVILGCWDRGNQYSHSILMVRPLCLGPREGCRCSPSSLSTPHLSCPVAESEPLCGRLD